MVLAVRKNKIKRLDVSVIKENLKSFDPDLHMLDIRRIKIKLEQGKDNEVAQLAKSCLVQVLTNLKHH